MRVWSGEKDGLDMSSEMNAIEQIELLNLTKRGYPPCR